MYDFYRNKIEAGERLAVPAGTDLPDHVFPPDWELMTNLTERSPEHYVDCVKDDIAARGFSYFKLV